MTGACLLTWVPLFMLGRDKVETQNTARKEGVQNCHMGDDPGTRSKTIKGRCDCLNLFERLSCWRDIGFMPRPQRAETEPTEWKLWVRNSSIKKEFSDGARTSTKGNASGVKKEDTANLKKERQGDKKGENRLRYRSNSVLWFLGKVGSSVVPWFNFAADCFIGGGGDNTLKNLWLCKCGARTLF